MSTYTQILYQIVFGSKDYTSFLTADNKVPLFCYIAGILKNKSCHSYIVGGYSNHIHIITHLHPTISLSDLVKDIKEASHQMMKKDITFFRHFPGWQVGYGAFTYNISSKNNLINYVKNQDVHHSSVSYKNELIELLNENSISFNLDYFLI